MFHIKKVKPMSDQQGKLLCLWKEVWLYRSVLENELPTHLNSKLSNCFPDEFMVSVANWMKCDDHFKWSSHCCLNMHY